MPATNIDVELIKAAAEQLSKAISRGEYVTAKEWASVYATLKLHARE